MKDMLTRLWRALEPGARLRLKFAVAGSMLVALLEVVGVALIVPLTQLLTDPDNPSGLLKRISDFFGNPEQGTLAIELTAIIFVTFLAKGVFTLFFRWWVLGFVNLNAAEQADNLFRRYMYAPYAFHLRRNSAELLRTLNSAVNLAYVSVLSAGMILITEGATMLAIGGVLLVMRPLPALAALVYFGLAAWGFMRFARRRAHDAGVELQETQRIQFQSSLQGLGGIKEVAVRGTQPYFVDTYADSRRRTALAQRMSAFLGEAPRYAVEMIFILGIAVMCAIIFTQSNATQGTATLALFVVAGFRIMPSITRVMSAFNTVRVGKRGVDLVLADFDELPSPVAPADDAGDVTMRSGLAVRDLEFSYPGAEVPALRGVSFDVPVGRSLAIVGASGAGKTTLVDLVLGLYEPTAGEIVVDGTAIASHREAWQRCIGLVPQEVYLLDDTIAANITFGEPDDAFEPARLAEAVTRAQLDDLIADLPEGLDTMIGERGVRLSGGQRQRIGIARALYVRPQLLVLDEATSALDNETERRITDTIDSLHGELTMVVVAHRLSTVRRCDQLIFMANGRIESMGTFEEVRQANETFAHLVDLGSLRTLDELEDLQPDPA